MAICEFHIEVSNLNRRNVVERALDDLLAECHDNVRKFESPHEATRDLLERYMAVVRSRNKVRRNWHPELARVCDLQTLEWISKKQAFQNSVTQTLHAALTTTSNGERVILERALADVVKQIVDSTYKPKPKKSKPSALEKIVAKILAENPEATKTEVINQMRSFPKDYGIVEVDDRYFVIQEEQGSGKQTVRKARSFSSVGNALGRVKKTLKLAQV